MKRAAILLACLLAAMAHDAEAHEGRGAALRHLSEAPFEDAATPFRIGLGGAFTLTDQWGAPRGEADPEGWLQLFFFGYAEYQAICTVASPRMAEIAEIAAEAGLKARPVLITVDAARDTPEAMLAPFAALHPNMVGLTGSEAELEATRRLFRVERKVVLEDSEYGEVFAHGSFIYLMDVEGRLLPLIPPVIAPARGAEIVARYAASGG